MKTTPKMRTRIRKLHSEGVTNTQLKARFGLDLTTIRLIVKEYDIMPRSKDTQ